MPQGGVCLPTLALLLDGVVLGGKRSPADPTLTRKYPSTLLPRSHRCGCAVTIYVLLAPLKSPPKNIPEASLETYAKVVPDF